MLAQLSGMPLELIVHAAVPVILFNIPFKKHKVGNLLGHMV